MQCGFVGWVKRSDTHAAGDGGEWRIPAAYLLPGLMVPPLRRLTFGRRPKSKQKVLPLASGSRCARLPSLHHCSRGRRTRAVPGPLRLSPHPCGSLPSTTIPFGLLNGGDGALDVALVRRELRVV